MTAANEGRKLHRDVLLRVVLPFGSISMDLLFSACLPGTSDSV